MYLSGRTTLIDHGSNDERALAVLQELKRVINTRASRRPDWFSTEWGLCRNFTVLYDRMYDCYSELIHQCGGDIKTWPLWSGDMFYPVPEVQQAVSPKMAYMCRIHLYDRRAAYCQRRVDLLDHLIAQKELAVKANRDQCIG